MRREPPRFPSEEELLEVEAIAHKRFLPYVVKLGDGELLGLLRAVNEEVALRTEKWNDIRKRRERWMQEWGLSNRPENRR